MWKSEKARCAAIRKMLSGSSVQRLWTDSGPTGEAIDLLAADGGPLSSGERVLLLAAFDLWNGMGKCRLSELLSTLDEDNLRLVAEALLARDG